MPEFFYPESDAGEDDRAGKLQNGGI